MAAQIAKERACLIAAQRGVALFSRGTAIYAVHPDGSVVRVAGSKHISDLWPRALRVLEQDADMLKKAPAPFRLYGPGGYYEADSLLTIILKVLLGSRRQLPPDAGPPVG